jgi:hypothetical protein
MKIKELIDLIKLQAYQYGKKENDNSRLANEEFTAINTVLAITQDVNYSQPLQQIQLLTDLHRAFQISDDLDNNLVEPIFDTVLRSFAWYMNNNTRMQMAKLSCSPHLMISC